MLNKTNFCDIATFQYGKLPRKDKVSDTGTFPIYSGYRIVGYCDDYLYEKPQLVIVARGVGGTGDVKISPAKSYITNLSIVVTLNESIVTKEFLYYYFLKNNLRYLDSGSAQSQITINDLSKVVLYLPTLDTQNKIVNILSSFDKKIENNIVYIASLQDSITEIYCNWFNDFNYPNATGELENGIPKDWQYIPFNMAVDRITQKNNPLQTEITITVSAKDGITSDYYKKRVASKDLSKYTVVEKGDFIYNRSSSTGYPVGVIRRLEEFEKVALSPIYFCFRAKKNVSEIYLKYYFNSKSFEDELSQIVGIGSRGHGMLNFNLKDLMNIQILLPPTELQLQFEEIAKPIEQKIALLKQENEVLAEIRDTLLPKLMSGELPVEVGEKNE